ncbi:putative disease resistance protein RGA3 [Asparagus officinalis]|uniref:putative disease resistance protein RGA3 n=1 Tax=Asparagus officinalis TaxID=4686 RepID=UPI00098E40F5|nr:putative disease resistance protein RGA3 [Asparagus officinalis]
MVVVGDVIVTKIIEKLVEIGFNYAADRYFARDTRMRVELERLNDALPRIQAVVEMAERGQQEITGALKKWLCQLTDALDEADNVLDDLDYLKLQKQVEGKASGSKGHGDSGRGEVRGRLSDYKQKVKKASERVFKKSDPTLEKLRGAVKRLDKVAAGVGNFISTLQLQESRQRRETGPSPTEIRVPDRNAGPALSTGKVFGRDEEREELLEWLKKDESSTSVSLFSIIGHGGMGKTTLTQLVYKDESLTNSFGRKIWVTVSTGFVVEKVMADIIESAEEKRPEVSGLDALQEALTKLASSKKFLLVLDDAWNDNNRIGWDKLFAPLRSGHKGSKILLTTRSAAVAKMAASALGALGGSINEPMKLKPLDDDNFLSLFKQHAFAGVDSCDYGKLKSIGEKIARRLGGSPLAAKTIGAVLNSKLDDSHWNGILHADNISDKAQERDGVMAVLMLSYHHLPMHLRPCFAYCSIFPQDYGFDKDDLVFMWMAIGLIKKSFQYPNETLEDTGRGYFDDLVKLSFLEQRYYGGGYNMHDLLHDLVRKVSDGDCFRFVGDMSIDQIPNTVRHLHFETEKLDLLKDVGKWKNLRTLVLVFRGYVNEHAKAFEEAFKSLESIRVLRLDVDGMNVLPDAISNLRHIRYLSSLHDISRLPSSFCRLYHLQVLYGRFSATESTVLGLNGLVSLRHMIPWEVYYEKIEGIGTLTSLQGLSFAAEAYKLSELKEMRDLRELKIRGLENHKHHEEVNTIELHRKRNLLKLELVWSDDSDVADEYEQMLDLLKPPDSLRELKIYGYQGARSPRWMEPDLLKNLEHVSLERGRAWKHLPSLGKLPYLMRLTLRGLPALQQINCEGGFQQLKYLRISHCEQWEEWCGLEAEAVPWCPLLKELVIWNCPRLKALPPLPLGLQSLDLKDVGLSDSPTFWVGSNCSGSSRGGSFSSTSSPSLYELRIRRCGELTSVAGLFRHHLTSLRWLAIENCPKLRMSPDTVTPADCFSLPSLESLWLVDCGGSDGPTPALLMQSSPTSLSTLVLGGDNHITAFPSDVGCGRFTSLRELRLAGCGELASIERLKAHLKYLTIRECPKLVRAAAETTSASIEPEEEQEFTSTVEGLYIDDPFLLHVEPLRRLTSVRWLEIEDCSHLEDALAESWLLQNSTSLQRLILRGKAKFLPSSLQTLSSLEYLELRDACELQSLPQLPSSLQWLEIRGCNEALKERCRENEGADWPNIQHIPKIDID